MPSRDPNKHRRSKSRRRAQTPVIRMDPDCAICGSPATMACECEAKGLDIAIKHAEHRMMQSMYNDIRSWVRGHAQDYILEYFRLQTERRKSAHSNHLERITASAYYHYHAPPHPNEIAAAQAALKKGIDEDWQNSVQRYPEVLEYFFSLVELTLPADDDAAVKDPPLSALNGSRKVGRRGGGGGTNGPPTIASGSAYHGHHGPPDLHGRRSPGPPARRSSDPRNSRTTFRPIHPPPAPSYYTAPPPPPPHY